MYRAGREFYAESCLILVGLFEGYEIVLRLERYGMWNALRCWVVGPMRILHNYPTYMYKKVFLHCPHGPYKSDAIET